MSFVRFPFSSTWDLIILYFSKLGDWACSWLYHFQFIWVGAIPDRSTDWVKNSMRTTLQRRTWGLWWTKSLKWSTSVRLQPRRPTESWTASKEMRPAGWERQLPPSTPPLWPFVVLGPPAQQKCGYVSECPENYEVDQRVGAPLLWKKGWKLGL